MWTDQSVCRECTFVQSQATSRALTLTAALPVAIACALLPALLAGCGSSQSNVAPSTFTKCGVSLTATTATFDASGGTAHMSVTTARECEWSATTNVSWITLPSSPRGQGNGSIDFTVAKNGDPSARTGSIGVSDQSMTIQQRAADCTYQLSTMGATVPAAGAARDIDVQASNGACHWTAQSQSPWITITSGGNGLGTGRVTFEAAPTSGPPRTGALVVAGSTVSVVQADGCTYVPAPPTLSVAAAGADELLSLTTGETCPWTAIPSAPWMGVAPPNSGSGPGVVHVTIVRNTGPERSGSVTLGSATVTVSQASGCSFTVSPASASFGATGGSTQATVTVEAGCPWNAATRDSWVSVSASGTVTGSGAFTITAAANTGPARSGTVAVAGHTISVAQASGCTFSVNPATLTFLSQGGAAGVGISASDPACGWSAAGAPPWLATAPGAGNGTGQVTVTAAPNNAPPRTAMLSFGDASLTVTQLGGCTYVLSASSANFDASGGTGQFQVTTVNGCRWKTTIQGGNGWVTLTRGDSGNGSGPVQFTVAPNSGPARTATLLIENHPFTISQAGAQ